MITMRAIRHGHAKTTRTSLTFTMLLSIGYIDYPGDRAVSVCECCEVIGGSALMCLGKSETTIWKVVLTFHHQLQRSASPIDLSISISPTLQYRYIATTLPSTLTTTPIFAHDVHPVRPPSHNRPHVALHPCSTQTLRPPTRPPHRPALPCSDARSPPNLQHRRPRPDSHAYPIHLLPPLRNAQKAPPPPSRLPRHSVRRESLQHPPPQRTRHPVSYTHLTLPTKRIV